MPGRSRPSSVLGVLVAVASLVLTTLLLYPLGDIVRSTSLGVLYVLPVLLISSLWGLRLGVVTALAAVGAFDVFHVPPTGDFTTTAAQDRFVLGVVLVAALVVAMLAERARSRAGEAEHRSETILESITDAFVAVDREWRYTYLNAHALASARIGLGCPLTSGDLLGRNCWEVFPELVGTLFYERLHMALDEQRAVQFEAYSPQTDSWLEVHGYPSKDGVSIYSRDITDRKRVENERERRAREQALLARLGLQALAGDDLKSLMDEAVALVARTLDVEIAGVAEIPVASGEAILRAGVGWREGVEGSRIEGGRDSQVGFTLLCRKPVVSENEAADPRFTPSAIAREHGVVSTLSVMIDSPDEPFGVFVALSRRPRRFSEPDVSFVQSVANVLASAVERIRAQERVGEVREIERRRIARDLHDEALQELTDAIVQADPGRSAGLDSETAERLVSTLKRVGRQLRGAIYDLRLAEEQSRPFPEALGALVEVHRAMAVDCEIGLDVTGESVTRLRGRRATEVLRIVGEALTNARRHSGARRVRVSVHGSGGTMSVEVTDDGRGFAARARAGSDGTGTRGMRERAALLGGDLDIRSRPGAGTSLRLELEPAADEARTATAARILLVEDHTAVREAIAAMLAQEPDLDVVAQAGSLAEARGMLHDVDVAVLDLGLPDGCGTELVTELRDVNPHAQALVLSASLDPAEIARATGSGAAAMLDKTAQLDELVQTVRRLHHSAALSS